MVRGTPGRQVGRRRAGGLAGVAPALSPRALEHDLPVLEKLYLEDLMAHRDPVEGLTAFLERRPPVWANR